MNNSDAETVRRFNELLAKTGLLTRSPDFKYYQAEFKELEAHKRRDQNGSG